MDLRKTLYGNIVLSGGSTLFKGMSFVSLGFFSDAEKSRAMLVYPVKLIALLLPRLLTCSIFILV